jgi:hypothetical protein
MVTHQRHPDYRDDVGYGRQKADIEAAPDAETLNDTWNPEADCGIRAGGAEVDHRNEPQLREFQCFTQSVLAGAGLATIRLLRRSSGISRHRGPLRTDDGSQAADEPLRHKLHRVSRLF